MVFNNLQRFNNTLTLMIKVFNKNQGNGIMITVNDSVLSGQIDVRCQTSGVRCEV